MDDYGFHILLLFVTNKLYNNELASNSLSVRVYMCSKANYKADMSLMSSLRNPLCDWND